MVDVTVIQVDDFLRFKKPHPCGGYIWKVIRIGVDFKLECATCGRIIMIARIDVVKRIKDIIKKDDKKE